MNLKLFLAVFSAALLVYATGAFLLLMEPDATTYALTSMEMYLNGDYLNLRLRGEDWLDKPHFQFWITALSYTVFGINDFAYRFPSLLFFLLGVYYTYLFGKKYYDLATGYLSALLLMTSLHLIISTSDVRAELILLGLTMMAFYHAIGYLQQQHWQDFVLACFAMGCLIMTKGIFTVIPIAGAVVLSFLFAGNWKSLLRLDWFLMIALSFFFTLPSIWAYYVQFDLHPEKEIFGQKNVSGVYFFLWDSQFGRFLNTGPYQGQGELLFFVHTLLWAYAPWALVAYFALYGKLKAILQKKDTYENYTFYGFLSMFVIFSLSKFQLPHYLNPILPLLSVVVAHELLAIQKQKYVGIFIGIQNFQVLLLMIALGLLHYFFIEGTFQWDTWLIIGLGIAGLFWIYVKEKNTLRQLVLPSMLVILMVGYMLNRDFYPRLLPYQSESQAAFYIKAQQLRGNLATHRLLTRAFDFYLQKTTPHWTDEQLLKANPDKNWIVFTDELGLELLKTHQKPFKILKSFKDFHITTLNATFLNKKTREEALKETYLLRLGGN